MSTSTIQSLELPMYFRLRIFWVTESLKKLVNLGLVSANGDEADYKIENVTYDDVDDHREMITDQQIADVIQFLIYVGEMKITEKDEQEGIITLLSDYKNNRRSLLNYCFECMMKQ